MHEKENENVGGLVISEEVIATIATNAALDINGVHSMVSKPVDLKGLLKKEAASKSVRIQTNDNITVLDLYICVNNGVNIPEVAEQVQIKVKDAVQNMTGYAVSKVNVHISDINLDHNVEEEK